MTTCPKCGGSSRRLLAPGYFECTTAHEMLSDVVPPEVHGGSGGIPVYRNEVCGVRYQSGEASPVVAQCFCGMFAIGACTQCGDPLCGEHILWVDDRVFCPTHAEERAEAARRRQDEADERRRIAGAAREKELRRQAAQEKELLRQAAPGFPEGSASGPELAAALERFVPSFKETFYSSAEWGPFHLGERPKRRRDRRFQVAGWGFRLDGEPSAEWSFPNSVVDWRFLVVLSDGQLYQDKTVGSPEGWRPHEVKYSGYEVKHGFTTREIGYKDLRAVLEQVLEWSGTRPPSVSPMAISGSFANEAPFSGGYRQIRLALERDA